MYTSRTNPSNPYAFSLLHKASLRLAYARQHIVADSIASFVIAWIPIWRLGVSGASFSWLWNPLPITWPQWIWIRRTESKRIYVQSWVHHSIGISIDASAYSDWIGFDIPSRRRVIVYEVVVD